MRVEHFSEHLEKSLDRVVANLPAKPVEVLPEQNSERERVMEALLKIAKEEEAIPEKKEEAQEKPLETPTYFSEEEISPDVQKRVETLINVAMERGIPIALKLSKKQDVFIQDALHDALIDKLLPELRKRGHL
jgi:hypothetical protein